MLNAPYNFFEKKTKVNTLIKFLTPTSKINPGGPCGPIWKKDQIEDNMNIGNIGDYSLLLCVFLY